jgi:pimeloyl-ACP methyl ester carboxylesterase
MIESAISPDHGQRKMNKFPITHRQLRANGIELHFAESGDPGAPLLILLHGFPEFWFAWRDYMSTLAASGFHVVSPDQRGYNLSEKPRGVDAYRLDILADDIAGLASALGQETFQIAGHDWGGSVAWSLASRHESRLKRMVVLNAPHPALWLRAMKDNPEQRRKSGYVRFLKRPWLPETVLRLGRYEKLASAFASARPDAFTADIMQAYHDAWRRPGALTAMLNWYRALLREPVEMPAPGTLSPPCLILWGDRDPFAIPKLADESSILCADAEVVHLAGAGHWIIYDAHETVLAYLRRFLQVK